jgi:myo-inositol-1(or 4)-monophosphatase
MGGILGSVSPTTPDSAERDTLPTGSMSEADARWLSCAEQMASAGKDAIQPLFGRAPGRVALGRGAGGDRTLELDRVCEEAIQEVLAARAPFPCRLVSEEAGISGPSDAEWLVVVDPVDGSLNAKRGLSPFCVSIGVADGPTMGDVRVGYIEDYLRPNVFSAVKGSGVLSAGEPRVTLDPQRFKDDLVEVILLEAGRPDRHHFRFHDLSAMGAVGRSQDMRVRQIGSLALALCYVATGAADILVAAVRSRSVDLAAGLVILTEAGGGAATLAGDTMWDQPLDLEKRCAFVAWRAGLDGDEIVARARGLREGLLYS